MINKISLLLIFLIALNTSSFSQSILKVGLTYTLGKEQSLLGKKKDKHHEKNVLSSFGGGLSIDVGYAYLTDDLYGPEATFTFFIGKPKVINHIESDNAESETVINRKLLYFSPSLFILAGSNNDINPYLSSGILFNLWEDVTKTETLKTADNKLIEKVWKVNFNKGIGYKSKIGALYNTNGDVNPYVEIQYQMISIGYNNEELLSYTVNNEDKLSTLSLSDKKHIYVPSLDHNSNVKSNDNFDANKPTSVLGNYANYNHVGVNAGAFFIF